MPGRATHGSTRYEGHSAIDAFLPIHATLAALEQRRNADPEPALRDYLRLYAGGGIPTLHYGPGSPREAHGPDESVPVDELVIVAEVLSRLLRNSDRIRQAV